MIPAIHTEKKEQTLTAAAGAARALPEKEAAKLINRLRSYKCPEVAALAEILSRLREIKPTLEQHVNPETPHPNMVFGECSLKVIPPIKCKDGTIVTIYASDRHYCSPKDNSGPYTHVEVTIGGTDPGPLHKHWDYSDADPTYCFVPLSTLRDFIDRHGGIEKVLVLNNKTGRWEQRSLLPLALLSGAPQWCQAAQLSNYVEFESAQNASNLPELNKFSATKGSAD